MRQTADNADEDTERTFYQQMLHIAGELDKEANFVPRKAHRFEFLDIGYVLSIMSAPAFPLLHRFQRRASCAPGGFTSYILRKNERANGTGITLPKSAGGHPFLVEPRYLRRYKLIEQDILQYDYARESESAGHHRGSLKPIPEDVKGRFALVILDGHALRTYEHGYEMESDELRAAHNVYRCRLPIAQFILALGAVSPGGTMLVRLSHIEFFPAAQFLCMLDELSESIVVHKPRAIHAKRATFYVIAKGVGRPGLRGQLRERYLEELRKLWVELGLGGPYGRGRVMVPRDLDFIASSNEILDGYLDRLIELGRAVWMTQTRALRKLFRSQGIE
ncbi:hypothetical protein C8Q74DRAFT_1365189 [Fomes fomentarius]|nr:hypothetical protein C8Q74DRAFT_1365189 [Fomes fomentarius]